MSACVLYSCAAHQFNSLSLPEACHELLRNNRERIKLRLLLKKFFKCLVCLMWHHQVARTQADKIETPVSTTVMYNIIIDWIFRCYSPGPPPPLLSDEAAETCALLVYFVRSSFQDPSSQGQVCDLPPWFQKGRRDSTNCVFIKCRNHSASLLNGYQWWLWKRKLLLLLLFY